MRSPALGALLAAALPLSCAAYEPGAFWREHDTWDVRTVGCLDVAVRALRDPVIAFSIGNRCPYPVGVDFRALGVRALAEDGSIFYPQVGDPRGELHEAVLDAHDVAHVALEFPVPRATPSFCVDVAALNVDTPAGHPEEMCFQTVDGQVRATGSSLVPPRPAAPGESCRRGAWLREDEPPCAPGPANAPPDLEAWP